MNNSPLRYPGGKNKLAAFIAKLCIDNHITGCYIEPYAGGASVGLFLLMNRFVNRVIINDKDRSIYAFWHAILNNTDEFCAKILDTEISITEWRNQQSIQQQKEDCDLFTLGFSTFFLNRTNRSGIIKAGVIGGLAQDGEYLMDCRFNKTELISRIRKIAAYKDNITLCNLDAIDLIDQIEELHQNDNNTLIYFDPPYYYKASSLYMSFYNAECHADVSARIMAIQNIKWLVSYDNVPEIRALYSNCIKKEYSFKHTAHSSRIGNEILFFSRNLRPPLIEIEWNPIKFKLKTQPDHTIAPIYVNR